MKKIVLLIGLLFFCYQSAIAACSYTGTDQKINFNFKNVKILSDDSLPTGTVLAVKKVGGNVASMKKFSNCSANDVYAIIGSAGLVEAPGVRGVQAGIVYETGISGIGFQISDAITGTNLRPVTAVFGSVPAQGLSSGNVEQITVWLIKTADKIDTNETGNNATVSFRAGPANQIQKSEYLLLQINLAFGPFTFKQTSCDVTPMTGSTVLLPKIEAKVLRNGASGMKTDSQREIILSIVCPDESVGSSYIYWFNPITDNSPTVNGVLLNSISAIAGGAKNVGVIIKMGTAAIKFYDYSSYKYASIGPREVISLTADYYKLATPVEHGEVHAIFEIVLQEE
ncbi:fimbrial protein [Enterobacteriaceae bacterium H4N4]|uniref:Fimbrial protein n=1 Tax=Silvania confinis TaxID=2926470 RepID=A0A9J6QJ20_9ENTR|nr:fimbrial protein [Silvania confinis]MCU6669298.1 fimbrial protein [Silvania confinis]